LEKKDSASDYYVRKDGPLEFYDVSRFFDGTKTWATFAEEGVFICNNADDSLCQSQKGYSKLSTLVIGAVLDAASCKAHLPSKVKSAGRFRVGTSQPYAFRETPAFYAYADIDGALYRLSLATTPTWGELSRLMQGGATTLIAEAANARQGGLCVFESKPK
jgi:hypothetical protein